jgi:hypothetical protein
MKLKFAPLATALAVTMVALPSIGKANTSFTINNTIADAFLATGSPLNPVGSDLTSFNFGGAGTLAIAPASSAKGRFDSIIKFNTASAINQFNSTYGAGNWLITGFTLSLASNFFNMISAGSFGIDWLGYDNWVEGTGSGMGTPGFPGTSLVSFNSIATLYSGGSAALGTFAYTPPGDNIYLNYTLPLHASLLADATAGGDLSLFFYAADNQVSYLFNSRSFAQNRPQLTLSATAVPEPSALAMLAAALGSSVLRRKSKD